jgi:hypothetical protein
MGRLKGVFSCDPRNHFLELTIGFLAGLCGKLADFADFASARRFT